MRMDRSGRARRAVSEKSAEAVELTGREQLELRERVKNEMKKGGEIDRTLIGISRVQEGDKKKEESRERERERLPWWCSG